MIPAKNAGLTRLYKILGLLSLIGIGIYFVLCMVRPMLVFPTAWIGNSEGWNAGHVLRMLAGLPLYPPQDELVTNNYPPLYFYLMACIKMLGGDLISAGRAICTLSLFASAGFIYLIARRMGFSRRAAAFGALILISTITRFFPYYIATAEPLWLAHAVMLCGLWLLVYKETRLFTILAIAAMLTAGLIKHNLIAIPLAAYVWLFIKDQKRFGIAFGAGAGLALMAAGALHLAYGRDFWFNLFNARVLTFDHWLHKHDHILAVIGMLGAAALTWRRNKKARNGNFALLILLHLLFAFIEIEIFGAGEGVQGNIAFDFFIAAALLAAWVWHHIEKTTHAERRALLLCLLLLAQLAQLASWGTARYLLPAYDQKARDFIATRGAKMAATAARLDKVKGEAWCDNAAVCYLAGKTLIFDRFNTVMRLQTGNLAPEVIVKKFREYKVKAVMFDRPGVAPWDSKTQEADNPFTPVMSRLGRDITPKDGYGTIFLVK